MHEAIALLLRRSYKQGTHTLDPVAKQYSRNVQRDRDFRLSILFLVLVALLRRITPEGINPIRSIMARSMAEVGHVYTSLSLSRLGRGGGTRLWS